MGSGRSVPPAGAGGKDFYREEEKQRIVSLAIA